MDGWKKEGRRRTIGNIWGGEMSHMVFSSGEIRSEEEMRELVPSVSGPSPLSTTNLDGEYIYYDWSRV
jgi:hypothetical protein